tara:strand:- start:3155 stop:3430 length:276 start_codon:yes stop_codon:yes gene_type:complete
MADRIYRQATPVAAGAILAKKGVMVVGQGVAQLKFYKDVDYSVGLTASEIGQDRAQDVGTPITGSSAGVIVPISVHTLESVTAGTTVYKLA